MLFSILALYLAVFPFTLPPLARPALLGAVEITTGIQAITQSVSGQAGPLLIIGSAAFGGFSGIFQTKSVLKMPDSPSGTTYSGRRFTVSCPVSCFTFSSVCRHNIQATEKTSVHFENGCFQSAGRL